MTIENILREYERPETLHSREPVKASLFAELSAEKNFCKRMYTVLFALAYAITTVSVLAVIADLVNGPSTRISLLSVAGIPVPFMLNWMRRRAEEWSKLSLLITLISHSDENAIQNLIEKLLSSDGLKLAATAVAR